MAPIITPGTGFAHAYDQLRRTGGHAHDDDAPAGQHTHPHTHGPDGQVVEPDTEALEGAAREAKEV